MVLSFLLLIIRLHRSPKKSIATFCKWESLENDLMSPQKEEGSVKGTRKYSTRFL
jgi:hypothetical protein